MGGVVTFGSSDLSESNPRNISGLYSVNMRRACVVARRHSVDVKLNSLAARSLINMYTHNNLGLKQ